MSSLSIWRVFKKWALISFKNDLKDPKLEIVKFASKNLIKTSSGEF